MNLLGRLKGATPQRAASLTLEQWAAQLNSFAYNNWHYPTNGVRIQETLAGQGTERPANTFEGLAAQAYQANGIVFACMLVRQLVFSSVRFRWQRIRNGSPSDSFGNKDLRILEEPWTGGTTQDMLSRLIQDADLAGNSYWYRETSLARLGTQDGGELVRLRPDWVQIVGEKRFANIGPSSGAPVLNSRTGQVGWRKLGYIYTEGGVMSNNEPVPFLASEVAHFAPVPDPLATFAGMSWLTPVLREIQADQAMTNYQRKYMDNGATPNMVIRHFAGAPGVAGATKEAVEKWVEQFETKHAGADNAFKTLHLYPGADATVVGTNLKEIDFSEVRGGGEVRIAMAANVPPVIAGMSKGLESSTYCGVYDQPVWTTRGVMKLGEIRAGDTVWSLVDGHIEPRKVLWQAQTGVKRVYTLRTKNRTIRFTDNHPILIRVPGDSAGPTAERHCRVEWRRVDELRPGDKVVQAQRLPDQGLTSLPNGAPATIEQLQWLGAYTGDGCLNGTQGVQMCLPVNDRARAHYWGLALQLFTKQVAYQTPGRRAKDGLTEEMVRLRSLGRTFPQIVDEMGLDLHPASVRDRVANATRDYQPKTATVRLTECRNGFQFSSKTAAQWHHDMGVTGTAATKRVPGWIFELSEPLRLAYLAGIVDTDGSVGKDGRLEIQFANRDLVEDVRMLLISCGIACSNVARVEFDSDVLPNPGLKNTYEAWRFVASSAVEVGRIPFADALYRDRVNGNQHRHRPGGGDAAKAGLAEGLGFYTIRSIEIEPAEPVFDIEVDGGHSFLADGVVVHNSNYSQARRRFADATIHPLWQNASGSLQRVLPPPDDASRLWYDASDVPFLREDEKDAAAIAAIKAETINSYITAGFEPASVVEAIEANDLGLLVHTGWYSVQLQKPGENSDAPEPDSGTDGRNGRRNALENVGKVLELLGPPNTKEDQ